VVVDLSTFNNSWYNPGRGLLILTLWHFVNAVFLQCPLNPSSRLTILNFVFLRSVLSEMRRYNSLMCRELLTAQAFVDTF
jgi:hypothetical protein